MATSLRGAPWAFAQAISVQTLSPRRCTTVRGVFEILGLDALFAEMVLGLGLALIIGNGLAWWKHRRGERPAEAAGEFRRGRVIFLSLVGVLMAVWGAASIFGPAG